MKYLFMFVVESIWKLFFYEAKIEKKKNQSLDGIIKTCVNWWTLKSCYYIYHYIYFIKDFRSNHLWRFIAIGFNFNFLISFGDGSFKLILWNLIFILFKHWTLSFLLRLFIIESTCLSVHIIYCSQLCIFLKHCFQKAIYFVNVIKHFHIIKMSWMLKISELYFIYFMVSI